MVCDQVSPLFIFNATFPASEECAAGKPNYDRYKSFCSSAVRIEENNLKSKLILVISLSIISYLSPSEIRDKDFQWDKGFENRGVTLESPSIDKKRAEQGERVVDDICG